ncbi:transcriptional regulator ovo isoform X2 [Musca autumnalis]|uniref:transcriptional regulator ovo isoform X2 n=1 Tax=Musca autumnalis TaxID=221902 RepID=UPI003CF76914
MPKIFLIKNRLHQQQQRLLESQNLLQDKNEDDRLVPPLSPKRDRERQLERSTSPQQYQPRPTPHQPFNQQPEDFLSSSSSSSVSPANSTNIASTSDSLKALHLNNHQRQQDIEDTHKAFGLTRSRSQSPINVLDLHHKKTSSSSTSSKILTKCRAADDYEGEDDEEQPLSLVSSLTYLGRKRFQQYHRNLRTAAAATATATASPVSTTTATTTTTTTSPPTPETTIDDKDNVATTTDTCNSSKEENNEVGPITSLAEGKDRLSPEVTTTTSNSITTTNNAAAAHHSRTPSPPASHSNVVISSCKLSSPPAPTTPSHQQDCTTTEFVPKVFNPKAEDLSQAPAPAAPAEEQNDSPKSASPKHRYISSYNKSLIGNVVLTQAQRKEYPLEIVQKIQSEVLKNNSIPTRQPSAIDDNSDSDSDSDDGSKLIVDEKPLVPEEQPLSLRVRSTPPPEDQRPSPPPCPEPAVRCSVIQRTPSAFEENQRRRSHEVLLPLSNLENLGPEQQEPIDYHVPRRKSTLDNDDEEQQLNAKRLERERKLREARRRSALLAARTILAQARVNPRFIRSLPGILAAAAGHGRTTSGSNGSSQGQGFQGGFGGSNGSGSQQPSSGGGSPTGFGGSGGLSGGAGGGMGGGRDGRAPSNFLLQNAAAYLMSAAGNGGTGGSGGQQYPLGGGDNIGGGSPPSLSGTSLDQTPSSASSMLFANGHGNNSLPYSSLAHCAKYNQPSSPSSTSSPQHYPPHLPYGPNPSAYGIILKDEPDIEYDEAKIDIGAFAQNIIQATMGNSGNFNASAYEDAIMSDLASAAQGPNGTVDPLQFTATLMLSSQTDHLLEQLSDAVDLSSFLQRNCVDDENSTSPRQDFELVSTPSLTPDSVSITPVDCHNSNNSHLDSFHENLMQQLTNNMGRTQQTAGNYAPYERQQPQQQQQQHHNMQQQQPPPSYQHATRDMMQMQQQQTYGHNQNANSQPPLNNLLNQNNILMQQQHYQQQQHGNNYHQLPHHQQQQQQQHPLSLNQQPNQQQQHHHHQQQQQQHFHHGQHGGHPSQHGGGHGHHAHQQQHHHHLQHHSDNSNLSLPSPNSSSATNSATTTANGHMMIPSQGHHPMSSAASNTSSGSASALLDTSLLDTKPIIQSVSPTHCQTSNGSRLCSSSSSSSSSSVCSSSSLSSNLSSSTALYKQKRSLNLDAAASLNLTSPIVAKLHESKVLQQRLGLPPEVQLEFVNGGHGIKNPLAIENTHGHHHHHRIRSIDCLEDMKKPALITDASSMNGGNSNASSNSENSQESNNFVCRICLKSFSLKRLLNRHMKCHSEIKRYLCTFCGKGFNDTFDLKRHTRTHTGVRPYKCNLCEKSFTQRCSLESHCLKVHSVQHQYAYKERRTKMYVCEECGHTTCEPEVHYIHLKENHPYSPALLKFYDKRHFKFNNSQFANNLLGQLPMPVHN